MEDTTLLDLDALLDGNLAAVPDVPDYVTPPEGTYMLSVADVTLDKQERTKDGKTIPVVVIVNTIKVEATLEAKGMPVADGSMFTERFTHSEEGLKYFKRFAKNVLNVTDVEDATLRDIFASLKESGAFMAVITHSISHVGEGENKKEYTNVRMRPVHEAA